MKIKYSILFHIQLKIAYTTPDEKKINTPKYLWIKFTVNAK